MGLERRFRKYTGPLFQQNVMFESEIKVIKGVAHFWFNSDIVLFQDIAVHCPYRSNFWIPIGNTSGFQKFRCVHCELTYEEINQGIEKRKPFCLDCVDYYSPFQHHGLFHNWWDEISKNTHIPQDHSQEMERLANIYPSFKIARKPEGVVYNKFIEELYKPSLTESWKEEGF